MAKKKMKKEMSRGDSPNFGSERRDGSFPESDVEVRKKMKEKEKKMKKKKSRGDSPNGGSERRDGSFPESDIQVEVVESQKSLEDWNEEIDTSDVEAEVVESQKSLEDWNEEIDTCTFHISTLKNVIDSAMEQLSEYEERLQLANNYVAAMTAGRMDNTPFFYEDPNATIHPLEGKFDTTSEFGTTSQSHPGHTDIISVIGSISDFPVISGHPITNHLISGHKNKLKSVLFCPNDAERFLTSAQDGIIKHWRIESQRLHADKVTEMSAMVENKWPADVSWDPTDETVVTVYDRRSKRGEGAGVTHVALSKFSTESQEHEMNHLQIGVAAHGEGGASRVSHMPWGGFVTAGAGLKRNIVFWNKMEEDEWSFNLLHSVHSNDVMGIAGLKDKNVVLTVGKDRKLVGYDCGDGGRGPNQLLKIDVPIYGILSNPRDENLLCIYANCYGSQIRLIDYRMRSSNEVLEVWKSGWTYGLQQSSQTQSTLISQDWSPCGNFIASGSGENTIQVFDVRRNSGSPTFFFEGHCKKVFRAVFHKHRSHLVSIASDYFIGFHDLTGVTGLSL